MAVQAPNTTLLSCGKIMRHMGISRKFREQPFSRQRLGELVTFYVVSQHVQSEGLGRF